MCDCIKNIEAALTDKMVELKKGCDVVEKVSVTNKSLNLESGNFRFFANITGRFKVGSRIEKFEDRLNFTYCPLCGEKY